MIAQSRPDFSRNSMQSPEPTIAARQIWPSPAPLATRALILPLKRSCPVSGEWQEAALLTATALPGKFSPRLMKLKLDWENASAAP